MEPGLAWVGAVPDNTVVVGYETSNDKKAKQKWFHAFYNIIAKKNRFGKTLSNILI